MDGYEQTPRRAPNPRRRKRTKMQNFKEAYLPVILLALVVLLIAIFVISSIRNALLRGEQDNPGSNADSTKSSQDLALEEKAEALLKEANLYASSYDYDRAIATLNDFPGDINKFDSLTKALDGFALTKQGLVTWNDLSEIPHLSFNMLVADAERTFSSTVDYAEQFRADYITTGEFTAILQQLYDKGYVLVRMEDMITSSASGYTVSGVSLPSGKMPIMLTETHANYYNYLSDGDYDGVPDADGAGFATQLILDENGELTCQMLNAQGETITGAFDIVPILEAFTKEHPDFSYHGSKATLAVTGYEGLFGYDVTAKDKDENPDAYDSEVKRVSELVDVLRSKGYTIASYTYDHAAYGDISDGAVSEDIDHWKDEIVPILGDVDTLVLAKGSDIANPGVEYSGFKFRSLEDVGFRFYIGYCEGAQNWALVTPDYIRQGRLPVSGQSLEETPDLFSALFDAAAVLDSSR